MEGFADDWMMLEEAMRGAMSWSPQGDYYEGSEEEKLITKLRRDYESLEARLRALGYNVFEILEHDRASDGQVGT